MSDTIYVKSPREIELMRQAGRITAGARSIARQAIRDGVTTKQIDKYVHDYIVKCGAKPTFLGYGGFPGSACVSVNEEAKKLIEVTRQSFFEGIKFAREGYRISDIGSAIQEYVEAHGFSVVRDYVGHGVGRELHEAPEVPNFRIDRKNGHRGNPRLVKGMTIAIEPMVIAGPSWEIEVLDNDWTVVSADRSLTCHYENTVAITDGEPEILTMADDI